MEEVEKLKKANVVRRRSKVTDRHKTALLTSPLCILTQLRSFDCVAEKGALVEALKQLEKVDKTRTTELGKVQQEVTRLQADAEKVKDEHKNQIK